MIARRFSFHFSPVFLAAIPSLIARPSQRTHDRSTDPSVSILDADHRGVNQESLDTGSALRAETGERGTPPPALTQWRPQAWAIIITMVIRPLPSCARRTEAGTFDVGYIPQPQAWV